MPVVSRTSWGASTSRSGTAFGAAARRPAERDPEPDFAVAATTTSSSVFHSEQPGHCPAQASEVWPHSRQTYLERALAIAVDRSKPAGRQRAPGPPLFAATRGRAAG